MVVRAREGGMVTSRRTVRGARRTCGARGGQAGGGGVRPRTPHPARQRFTADTAGRQWNLMELVLSCMPRLLKWASV
ncbi:hypothetical protein GCM10010249_45590 [Streptomyces roseolilacinus]|uniref:Uncharacterized protein n=1 Tax=Streptomyces roseolilacinus TaxID=66904 RepID=A0A918B3J4_9ACTN|nr:hypothetical protein GCM10010249_45590 [Streptomyces roseolilacinus]